MGWCMSIESIAPYHRLKSGFDPWMREMTAGAVCALVTFVFSLSYAALIFSGPLSPWLAYGLAATFTATAAGATVMALRSSFKFSLAAPDVSTTAIVSALVATFVGRLNSEGAGDNLLAPTLIVLSLTALLSGLVLYGLGLARAGRAVRFVPYPVIGGFLGAAGWLIAAGAIRVITGHRVDLAGFEAFLDPLTVAKFAAGAAVAGLLIVCRPRFKGPFAQPVQLLLCAAAVYAGLKLSNISLTQAQVEGWLFHLSTAAQFSPPWSLGEWQRFPWHLLPELIANLISVIFVATVAVLLNFAGFEVIAKRETNIDRELATVGLSNLVSAAFGGYVTGVPMSRSTLAFKLAGNSRIPNIWIAASSVAMLGISPAFINYVPKCVVGGLLLSLGIDLLYRWLISSARQLARIEYISLLLIALIIVNWGFIAGILIGIVISCATFAFSVGRVSAINFSFDGSKYRSTLDRGSAECAILNQYGGELQGMSLHSYLFFGSANQIYQNVKAMLTARPDCRYFLFDFQSVIGIDSSATYSFMQIKQAIEKCGGLMLLVNLSPTLYNTFRAAQIISDGMIIGRDLDHALEFCENGIIEAHQTEGDRAPSLQEWLADALASKEYADVLAEQCKRVEVRPGEIIARQGERADSMHFILQGRIGIFVNLDDGRSIRVRSLGPYTSIGEMGLITSHPRSATVQAEVASVLYVLGLEAFELIRNDYPFVSEALLTYVVKVMAERLVYANSAIGILQR